VVGFKPPHGRNPDGPPANFDRFNHCGPMTRSVADAALMQNITSGPHPLDHDSLRQKVKLPLEAAAIKGMKIAFSTDLGYVPVEREVRSNIMDALDVFRRLGAKVEEVNLGWTEDVEANGLHWYNTLHFGRQTIWQQADNSDLMTDYALKFADLAKRMTGIDDVHKVFAQAHRMYQTLGPVLAAHDVFICPTNNAPSVKADHDPFDPHFTVAGKKVDAEYGWVMTHQFNMLHNCPVISLPSGHAATGVPTGIQIVGRTYDDARVFKAALAYEKAVGGWYTGKGKRPLL
jgi:amidase